MFALFHTVTADDATPCTLLEHGPQEIEIFMNKIDDNVPYANGPMIISFERALRIVSPLRGFDRPRPFIDLRVFVDFRVISGFHFEVDESTRVCNSVRIHTGTLGPCRSNGWIHGLVVGSFSASQSATCRLSTFSELRDAAVPFVPSYVCVRRRGSSSSYWRCGCVQVFVPRLGRPGQHPKDPDLRGSGSTSGSSSRTLDLLRDGPAYSRRVCHCREQTLIGPLSQPS